MQFLTGSMISVVICVAAFVWMKKHPGKADFRVLYLISLNLEEFLQRIRVTIHNCKAGFFWWLICGTGRGGGVQVTAVDPRSYSTCQITGAFVAGHQTGGEI